MNRVFGEIKGLSVTKLQLEMCKNGGEGEWDAHVIKYEGNCKVWPDETKQQESSDSNHLPKSTNSGSKM